MVIVGHWIQVIGELCRAMVISSTTTWIHLNEKNRSDLDKIVERCHGECSKLSQLQ